MPRRVTVRGGAHTAAMTRWDPWAALAETDIELWYEPLVGQRGRWARAGDLEEIVLEETLDRRTRRAVLAHELVHAERRIGRPSATVATMQLEEERVWRAALDRLAPPEEVRRFVGARASVGPVTVADLADEFDLPLDLAERLARLAIARQLIGGPAPSAGGRPSG